MRKCYVWFNMHEKIADHVLILFVYFFSTDRQIWTFQNMACCGDCSCLCCIFFILLGRLRSLQNYWDRYTSYANVWILYVWYTLQWWMVLYSSITYVIISTHLFSCASGFHIIFQISKFVFCILYYRVILLFG